MSFTFATVRSRAVERGFRRDTIALFVGGTTIGSIRRECTDHIIPMSQKYLLATLRGYVAYYNEARTHQSLDGNAPIPRRVERTGQVIATPVLGGLHHRYSRAA